MARKVVLVDDLDGSELDESGSTVTFSLRGVNYEIDLSAKNQAALDKALSKFVDAARPVQTQAPAGRAVPRQQAKKSVPAASSKEQLDAIREWANKNGYTVSPRGRIAQSVVDAFSAAH